MHRWPNYYRISSNSYEYIVFTRCLSWPSPLTFWLQNPTSTSTTPSTSLVKIGCNSLRWLLKYGVHKVLGTHRRTNSLTDGQTRKQHAFGTVDLRWRKHKNQRTSSLVYTVWKCVENTERITRRLGASRVVIGLLWWMYCICIVCRAI